MEADLEILGHLGLFALSVSDIDLHWSLFQETLKQTHLVANFKLRIQLISQLHI